jgi:hypothetical protein
MAGFASGTTTFMRIWNSPAPSTRAASDSSWGIVMKNWRSRKIENASPKNTGTISGLSEPDPPPAHEDHVQRHDRHLYREHQGGQHQDERHLPAPATTSVTGRRATGTHETTTPRAVSPA